MSDNNEKRGREREKVRESESESWETRRGKWWEDEYESWKVLRIFELLIYSASIFFCILHTMSYFFSCMLFSCFEKRDNSGPQNYNVFGKPITQWHTKNA